MPRKSLTFHRRNICFVTGTRAEFGLMTSALSAIAGNPRLKLQIVATGMHLDQRHGNTIAELQKDVKIDAVIPWNGKSVASATGKAIAHLADAFAALNPDIVLIVGDRVEAFAAATAAHLCGIAIAHIHGGDRALGQVDDSLRHAITKLSHLHLPATSQSAKRILKLGEDAWRVHKVGSPGIDGIHKLAASPAQIKAEYAGLQKHRFALIVLHPVDADEAVEFRRAKMVLNATAAIDFERIIIVYPNNDRGSRGIMRCWETLARGRPFIVRRNVPRPLFLGLLRDAAVLVGNSSSGIIEAASFSTPVVDIGPRQLGRERCEDVRNVPYRKADVQAALKEIWNAGRPLRASSANPYGGYGAGAKIARILATVKINSRLLRKLISY
jgi:UDP-hydrolysing UDP-N-acetyl-D-glucosamine 2-epimerase